MLWFQNLHHPSLIIIKLEDIIVLCILAAVNIAILYRFKLTLDGAELLTIVFYLVVAALRTVNDFVNGGEVNALTYFIITMSEAMIYLSLYFFVYEMQFIKRQLQSETLQEY